MEQNKQSISEKLSFKRMLIPILIGAVVAGLLLYRDISNGSYQQGLDQISWTWYVLFWFILALIATAFRDLGYIIRLRILTNRQLKWNQAFRVIMLWEFASAITPSVVGGSGVAIFIMNREGVSIGRSTAVVMVTALLDEFFYITMVPIVILLIGASNLLQAEAVPFLGMNLDFMTIFWIGYGFILFLTTLLATAVFFHPRGLKALLLWLFKFPVLKKWRYRIVAIGDDIIITSNELRGMPFSFWIRSILATYFSWTARFCVVNFLIQAVMVHGLYSHLEIYGRQLVMWVIMLISPTPGGSGVAEVAFSGFLSPFIPIGFAGALAFVWRLVSYYLYLFIGSFILPGWIKKTSWNLA